MPAGQQRKKSVEQPVEGINLLRAGTLKLPDFIKDLDFRKDDVLQVCAGNLARSALGDYRFENDSKPLSAYAIDYCDRLGSQASDEMIILMAASLSYFAAFVKTVEHFGGLDKLKGKRIVELGGGVELPQLRPALALHQLGADVAIVDREYPRSEGIFVKADILEYLNGLKGRKVDAFLAFDTLEKGSKEFDDSLQQAFNALVSPMMGKIPQPEIRDIIVNTLLERNRSGMPREDAEAVVDGFFANFKPRPNATQQDVDRELEKVDIPAREVYLLMRKRLKPSGIAVVKNRFDDVAVQEAELRSMGFLITDLGRDVALKYGTHVLRVLKPRG
jgi:hypothetical protein